MMEYGVIVGCDSNQEWLLPWWWEHYCRQNSYSVMFVDFGMSENALAWCRKKGELFSLPGQEQISSAWFKKPLALLHSPFPYACWIDLDCQLKSSLSPLFNRLTNGADIALVREPEYVQKKSKEMQLIFPDEISYNSGVVVFRQGANIIWQWAALLLEKKGRFYGDQDALSRAIYLHRPPLVELPSIYNWKMNQGPNADAEILHFVSTTKGQILLSLDCKRSETSLKTTALQ